MKRRLFSLLMVLVLTLCLLPASVFAHGSNGIANNGTWGLYIDIYGPAYEKYAKKAYGGNAYTSVGCAWYACARAYELTGIDTVISSGASFYNYRYAQYGYTRGRTIRAKALACYSGHTSVVEEVRGDQVLISEGGWPVYGNDCCIIQVKSIAEVEKNGFIGYVYLPDSAPAMEITRDALDTAVIGEPYFQSIYCAGEELARFSLTAGRLPLGLTLSENGIIRGKPLELGTFPFSISAESSGDEDSVSYTLTVRDDPAREHFFLRFESEGQLLDAWECTAGSTAELDTYLPEREGYTFTGWYADDALCEPIEEITVTADVSVYAGWELEDEASLPFRDVGRGDWCYDSVLYVWRSGLMGGTSAETFTPNAAMTRQMLWVVLARLSGAALNSRGVYASGRDWAVAQGISDGSNAAAPLTRQQLVTMLYRAVGSPSVRGDLSAYRDGGSVPAYAVDALIWAVNNGLISGYADGLLHAYAYATRAQVAAIVMRYCKNVLRA